VAKFSEVVHCIKDEFDKLRPGEIEEFLVGRRYVSEQRGTGDVVWVSTGGTFLPHSGSGPGFHGDDEATSPMLKDRVVRFQCFIWGDTEDAVEGYMDSIVRAMDVAIGWNNFDVTEYTDVTEESEQEGYTWKGRSFALSGTIRLMIPREEWLTATITSAENNGVYT
jgi:hypothetical protein